jgi:hypothetical protein
MRRALAGFVLLVAGAAPALAPEPPAGLSQRGALRILQGGQPIGSERYDIAATPTEVNARATVELRLGEAVWHQTSSLMLGADLAPRRYEFRLEAPTKSWVRMDFQSGEATVRFPRSDGKEDQQVFSFRSPRVALLDNNFFHQYLLLARLYDFAKGGAQTFEVFVPQAVQPGEMMVELVGVETQSVAGKPEAVRHLRCTTADNSVEFWVSASGRFVRLTAADGKVEVLPEGPGST